MKLIFGTSKAIDIFIKNINNYQHLFTDGYELCVCSFSSYWKLLSSDSSPNILNYGMEGLEGLRIGNYNPLEILIHSDPDWTLEKCDRVVYIVDKTS